MKGIFRKLAVIAAGIAAIGAPVASNASTANGTTVNNERKAVQPHFSAPRVQQQRLNMIQTNSYGQASGKYMNQRQYRKYVRQNPHLRKSKKHRSKN